MAAPAGGRSAALFMKSDDDYLSPTSKLAAGSAGGGSGVQEDSQRGGFIPKALSCQEDLYSADRGDVICRAFEIQMMSSTPCPTDGFESSHESRATEMQPTRAGREQKD